MLVVERNTTFVNWTYGMEVNPFSYTGDVVIAIDPSKTNTAMIIGTPEGHILNILEFSGNNRGSGPVQDTTVFCDEMREFLRAYLSNCNIYVAGIEKTILQKNARNSYISTTVLNEIRSALLSFFLEQFRISAIEVNNWSWKSSMLPEGYRSIYVKGSKKFFLEKMPDSDLCHYFKADVTDCYFIYKYLCKERCSNYTMYCNRAEPCLSGYDYSYVPKDSNITTSLREVEYNNRFTVDENLAFYCNRILTPFCMTVSVDDISLDTIYGRSMLFKPENLKDSNIKIMVVRK